jgi:hypothetical protein
MARGATLWPSICTVKQTTYLSHPDVQYCSDAVVNPE